MIEKRTLLLILGLTMCVGSCARSPSVGSDRSSQIVGEIDVVPKPVSIRRSGGAFSITAATTIVVSDEAGRGAAALLNEILGRDYGATLVAADKGGTEPQIVFRTNPDAQNPEAYRLLVAPDRIEISGGPRGMYHAVRTLFQTLPTGRALPIAAPSLEITDQPRFGFRAMHLDVARRFMPVEFVKKYIEVISMYKYNYFHWHLTDDQGWRIEIKKYPKLTTVGSYRPETVVEKRYRPYVGDNRPVSGFYTQEEIRDIVDFASRRQVTIIPEIELPGHSSAALASYPEIGCESGRGYKVKTTWGGFPDVVCPSEAAFEFIEGVINEVSGLFPNSPYIHIGGDEVVFDQWRSSSVVREIKQRFGLSSEREVKSWFVKRVAAITAKHGKRVIGWDDILGDRLDQDTTILSWQGLNLAADAARAGHDVVVAPADFTYFDHPQGDPDYEPLSLGKEVSLERVYGFEPIPRGLTDAESAKIIGGEGCVWTEFIERPMDVEYMAVPRLLALSEVLWSPRENRSFREFYRRLAGQFPRLDRLDVAYRIPEPLGFGDRVASFGRPVRVNLESPVRAGRIYFTTDGGDPHRGSRVYGEPFDISLQPNQTVEMKARVIGPNGRQSGIFRARFSRPGRRPNSIKGR